MYRYFSFALLIAVILILVYAFYRVMAGFFLPLFLAALLVVIFRPVHHWFLKKCKGRQKTSAMLTTCTIMVVVLLPMALVLIFAAAEGRTLARRVDTAAIGMQLKSVRTRLNLDMPSAYEFDQIEVTIDNTRIASMHSLEDVRGKLSDLIGDARELGAALQLPWPNDLQPSDTTGAVTAGGAAWDQFVRQLEATGAQIDAAERLAPGQDPSPEEEQVNVRQAKKGLSDSIAGYVQFKNAFLGGSAWAWVKEMANPTDEEFDGYLAQALSAVRTRLFSFGSATTSILVQTLFGVAIMVIALYFFLKDGSAMLETFKGLSPLDDEHEDELISEFDRISRAVVVATLLSAVVQGLLAGLGFFFAGVDAVFLLMMLTTLFALVPFVGAAAIWVPTCLWLYFIDGNWIAAIGLAIYGTAIISMADNVIKPWVLHGQSNLHPLWALLSVLGGVTAMGPIGILVGPMVLAFLQTLLKILQRELGSMERQSSPEPGG